MKLTDEQKFVKLMTEFKIQMKKEKFDFGNRTVYIISKSNNDDRVTGYAGFFTQFTFNVNGSFENMGAYE